MKVKEIINILHENNIEVEEYDILMKLSNVGIEADEETDIPLDVVKKLGKLYKVEIKPIKPKKVVKTEATKNITENAEESDKKITKSSDEVKKTKPIEREITKNIKSASDNNKYPENKQSSSKPKINIDRTVNNQQNTKNNKSSQFNNQNPRFVNDKKTSKPLNKTVSPNMNKPIINNTQNIEEEIELKRVYDDKYDAYVKDKEKVYTRLKNVKKNKKNNIGNRQNNLKSNNQQNNVIYYVPGMTVADIADELGLSVGEIVRKLVMLGYMVSASEAIEKDVIEILAEDSGYSLKDKKEEDITKFENLEIVDEDDTLVERPPIVTIMGHVDHGKTTLLDTIRNSRVVATEAGGITQHIGAYQVEKNGKLITFIDTPGHAAFTEMRARGAEVTDIVILVVAADDGVMPQTKEAVEHAKAAKVPIIVAVNKMDKVGANPDKVKQELASLDLLAEDWGGKTIFVPISALTGKGVDELLEMILLTAEMEEYKANPNRLGLGTVIEAKLDRGKGPVATLLVKNGTMRVGDPIVVGNTYGKVRAMTDETRANIKVAGPSKAVEVTGLVDVPQAGDHFMIFEDEKTARLIAEERSKRAFDLEKGVGKTVSLASIFDNIDDSKELNLIIKGDVQGSLEALKGSLDKLDVEGIKVNVVRSSVGNISDTDISLAVASKSIIIAFNVRPTAKILDYAKEKKIEVRMYNIIYKLLEDIESAMKGMLDPVFEEKILGQAEVRNTIKVSKLGTIAGCYVTDGLVQRGCEARLIREGIVVYSGKIDSLKRFKDDVKEVKAGYECGLMIENYNDIKEQDIIECFTMEKVKR